MMKQTNANLSSKQAEMKKALFGCDVDLRFHAATDDEPAKVINTHGWRKVAVLPDPVTEKSFGPLFERAPEAPLVVMELRDKLTTAISVIRELQKQYDRDLSWLATDALKAVKMGQEWLDEALHFEHLES